MPSPATGVAVENPPPTPQRQPTTIRCTTCVGSRVVTRSVPPSAGSSDGVTSIPGVDGYPASAPLASAMRTVTRGGRLRSSFSDASGT